MPDEYSIVALVREKISASRLAPRTDILEQADGIRIHTLKGLEIYHQTFMFWMKKPLPLPGCRTVYRIHETARADIIESPETIAKTYQSLSERYYTLVERVMMDLSQTEITAHVMNKEKFS